jgi:hypothetical protein
MEFRRIGTGVTDAAVASRCRETGWDGRRHRLAPVWRHVCRCAAVCRKSRGGASRAGHGTIGVPATTLPIDWAALNALQALADRPDAGAHRAGVGEDGRRASSRARALVDSQNHLPTLVAYRAMDLRTWRLFYVSSVRRKETTAACTRRQSTPHRPTSVASRAALDRYGHSGCSRRAVMVMSAQSRMQFFRSLRRRHAPEAVGHRLEAAG